MDFRPTVPSDAAALSDFLRRMFQSRADASFLAGPHMGWKYWSARPHWNGSRSFAASRRGAIVAHAAAWPVRVTVPGHVIPAVHLIDWAADPEYPGAGAWLLRQIRARARLLMATGGSEMTRRILPALGFRSRGEICWFARPVRPLRQALTTAEKDWKLPARWLRNTAWRCSQPLSLPRRWRARALSPQDVPDALWPQPSAATAVTERDRGLYQYLVQSPCARHALFGLEKRSTLVGYFCLAFAPHVARIADLWLPSTDVEDWCAAFRTAAVVAAGEKDVNEVSAWATTAVGKEALGRAGFQLRDCSTMSALGDATLLEGRTLHLQMLDSDAGFLSGDAVSYLTC